MHSPAIPPEIVARAVARRRRTRAVEDLDARRTAFLVAYMRRGFVDRPTSHAC
ncbi:hypothetical protein AAFN86_00160 [Roseomonas sp. CAU 1739]|uniref:hypothetical protein n=1 Tax=Roseomonas sp. CAU 1739 TaxID=3140364 RepID=UPI00325AC1CE